MCPERDKWLIVVNVFAASRKAGSIWKKAAAMLDAAAVSYKAEFTGGTDNAMEISRKAACAGYRKFVAVGGDGTIHDVLNGIAGFVSVTDGVYYSDFTIGVLPVGSGNDWIRSTGVPKDLAKAVPLIAAGNATRQDVVKVSILKDDDVVLDSYMANIGGVGLDARVAEMVNKKKEQGKRGKMMYASALLYCIKHRSPVRAKVVCDGNVIFDGKYLSIAFGTGKYSGGGMRQTSLAVMDDGLLDVVVIPDISMWTIARKVPRLFTGTFHKVDILTQTRCREVLVLPYGQADAEPVEVDGEIIGRAPVRMTVLPDQINIIANL
jgi:YegS/Rv2252/BmrU family lipid kinase